MNVVYGKNDLNTILFIVILVIEKPIVSILYLYLLIIINITIIILSLTR